MADYRVLTLQEDTDEEEYFDFAEEAKEASKLMVLTYAFVAFGFSQITAVGELSPFSAAFLCCIPFEVVLPCFIAASVGNLLALDLWVAMTYTGILAFCAVIRLIIHKLSLREEINYGYGAIAFVAVLGIRGGIMLAGGFELRSLGLIVLESIMALLGCMFFLRSMRIPLSRVGFSQLPSKDIACLALSFCLFLMSFSGFSVEGISPGRVMAAWLVMFVAFYRGPSSGAAVGICVGAALCISPEGRFLFACYALSGLLSALFASFGQIVTATVFGAVFGLCCLMSGDKAALICFAEAATASVCFVIMPQKWLGALQDFLQNHGFGIEKKISTEVSANLHAAAHNIYEVAAIVGDVCERLDSIINPEVNKMFASLQQNVCDGCANKNYCWNKMFDSTARDVMIIAGIEKRTKGRLALEKRCERLDILGGSVDTLQREYLSNMAVKMKIREMRKALTDQFCGMGDFLTETANKVQYSRSVDAPKSVSLRTALSDAGAYTDALSLFTDIAGKITVEAVLVGQSFESDTKKMKTVIEVMTGRRFDEAKIDVTDVRTRISFQERPRLNVQVGYAQKAFEDGCLCGDSVRVIDTPDGNRCALVSDGMGTGSRAAIDSTMTVSIMEKLIGVGFSFGGALKIVNSAMIMKSTDESMATIDAVCVNVYTGSAEFFKAGATVSFIRSGNQVHTLQKQSLPVGIIRGIGFAGEKCNLEQGDIVLLVSDGVTQGDCVWISDELLAWSTNDMEALAQHIVNLATLRQDELTRDDITAVAIKVNKNRL